MDAVDAMKPAVAALNESLTDALKWLGQQLGQWMVSPWFNIKDKLQERAMEWEKHEDLPTYMELLIWDLPHLVI